MTGLALWLSVALAGGLDIRDVVDQEVFSASSEHFALWSGPDHPLSADDRTRILDSLEEAWRFEFDALGYRPPAGTDIAKLNVLIHSSGLTWTVDGTAVNFTGGASAYVVDPDGWPVLLIDPSHVDVERWAESEGILAHELAHASQAASRSFAHDGWYPEASAIWTQARFRPSSIHDVPAWYGWVGQPAVAMEANYFDRGLGGLLHAYGQFAILDQLALHFGDALIVDSWNDTGGETWAVDRLDQLLHAHGTSLHRELPRAVAHAWVLDSDGREALLEGLSESFEAEGLGTDPWLGAGDPIEPGIETSPVYPPERYGVGVFTLQEGAGSWDIRIRGERYGSAGTPTEWGAYAVAERPEYGFELYPIPVEHGLGSLTVTTPEDTLRLWVLTVPLADELVLEEAFGVRVLLDTARPSPPREDDCGCGTGPLSATWLALPVAALLRRRRAR